LKEDFQATLKFVSTVENMPNHGKILEIVLGILCKMGQVRNKRARDKMRHIEVTFFWGKKAAFDGSSVT
jgi:hypothetical protein